MTSPLQPQVIPADTGVQDLMANVQRLMEFKQRQQAFAMQQERFAAEQQEELRRRRQQTYDNLINLVRITGDTSLLATKDAQEAMEGVGLKDTDVLKGLRMKEADRDKRFDKLKAAVSGRFVDKANKDAIGVLIDALKHEDIDDATYRHHVDELIGGVNLSQLTDESVTELSQRYETLFRIFPPEKAIRAALTAELRINEKRALQAAGVEAPPEPDFGFAGQSFAAAISMAYASVLAKAQGNPQALLDGAALAVQDAKTAFGEFLAPEIMEYLHNREASRFIGRAFQNASLLNATAWRAGGGMLGAPTGNALAEEVAARVNPAAAAARQAVTQAQGTINQAASVSKRLAPEQRNAMNAAIAPLAEQLVNSPDFYPGIPDELRVATAYATVLLEMMFLQEGGGMPQPSGKELPSPLNGRSTPPPRRGPGSGVPRRVP